MESLLEKKNVLETLKIPEIPEVAMEMELIIQDEAKILSLGRRKKLKDGIRQDITSRLKMMGMENIADNGGNGGNGGMGNTPQEIEEEWDMFFGSLEKQYSKADEYSLQIIKNNNYSSAPKMSLCLFINSVNSVNSVNSKTNSKEGMGKEKTKEQLREKLRQMKQSMQEARKGKSGGQSSFSSSSKKNEYAEAWRMYHQIIAKSPHLVGKWPTPPTVGTSKEQFQMMLSLPQFQSTRTQPFRDYIQLCLLSENTEV